MLAKKCDVWYNIEALKDIHHSIERYAGVAELADALDLGSSSSECRFDSCRQLQTIVKNKDAMYSAI